MKKYYITTPIYYVNDIPHIGHAYTTIAADTLARWHRLHGRAVFFLTGTDEHGQKIFDSAKAKNRQPKECCDEIVENFRNTWKKLLISNDYFVRTTDPAHEEAVKHFLSVLHEKEFIYKASYKGLYCPQCENFLTESELVDCKCPNHLTKPEEKMEENYFFRLSGFREKLIEIISDSSNPLHFEIMPEGRKNEILGKLKVGLEDISISRATMPWGIPIPFDNTQTTYVWIDALLNYISAAGYPDTRSGFSELWPADLHLLAKDILWFHTVIWPALLLAAELPLPKKIFAHGYFTINGKKMSKTIGNVITPDEMIGNFGVDASRYLLLSAFPFGTDGDFSMAAMKEKYNSELANNLGNLASRVISMLARYNGKKIPPAAAPNEINYSADLEQVAMLFEKLEFSRITDILQKVTGSANKYIDDRAPWQLAKQQKQDELKTVLSNLCEVLWVIAHYIYPFMPVTAQNMMEQLGQEIKIENSPYFMDKKIEINYKADTNSSGAIFPRLK